MESFSREHLLEECGDLHNFLFNILETTIVNILINILAYINLSQILSLFDFLVNTMNLN